MSSSDLPPESTPSGAQYLAVQASPEFQELRSRLRRFVFPTTVFFLLWYAGYVLLGLGQFLTTFLITGLYVRFANRELDPRAEKIRNEMHWSQQ